MDQVERSLGDGIDREVQRADLNVGCLHPSFQPSHVEIRREDVAGTPDAFPEPACDGTASGSDLETPPSFADTEPIEMAGGPVIEQRRKGIEPLACLGVSVVEEVSRPAHPSRIGAEWDAPQGAFSSGSNERPSAPRSHCRALRPRCGT